jgi:phosphatidylglycerophosphate synthase
MKKRGYKSETSINDIRKVCYPVDKLLKERLNVWGLYVLRPLSFYVTWVFLKIGVSANTVTFLSYLIGVIGCVLLALGGHYRILAGAILINLRALLDYADGNIARFNNSTSKYGEFIDSTGTIIMAALLFPSIGIGGYLQPDRFISYLSTLLPRVDVPSLFLFLGVWTSLMYIFPLLIARDFSKIFNLTSTVAEAIIPRNSVSSLLYVIAFNLHSMGRLLTPLLLVLAIFKVLTGLLALCALMFTLDSSISLSFMLLKASRWRKDK